MKFALFIITIALIISACTPTPPYVPEEKFLLDHCMTKHEGEHNITLCMKSTNVTQDREIINNFLPS